MSTKIYLAYRIKKSRWIEFIDLIHDQMFSICVKRVKKLMQSEHIDEDAYTTDIKKYNVKSEIKKKRLRKWAQFKKIWERFEKAATDPLKTPYDIECGTNFWLLDQYVYVIPIMPYWVGKELKMPYWVEDYSYWNNTDHPKNISDAAWYKRGETWKRINCGTGKADHNARRLYHEVINMSVSGRYISKTDLH